jgi:hypothetical protein
MVDPTNGTVALQHRAVLFRGVWKEITRMKRMLFFVLFLLAVSVAHAAENTQACTVPTLAALAHVAHVDGTIAAAPEGVVIAQACKPMPGEAGTIIAVAAFGRELDGDAFGTGTKQQVIALVDAASARVVAWNQSTVEDDALTHVGESSYRIDTAPYRLALGVRAFGVVFVSDARGASCPDASAEGELTLWLHDQRQLRPVLGTNIDGWVSVEGTACGAGSGAARSENAHITLAMEPTESHGFADISLTAHITSSVRTATGEFHDGPSRTQREVLKYDGTSYGNDMFRNFWYPPSAK